jgi:hypothetical protein
MNNEDLTSEDLAEILRKKQKYREWILSGRIVLPHDKAARLLGPDCLYHLYSLPVRCVRAEKKAQKSKRRSGKS